MILLASEESEMNRERYLFLRNDEQGSFLVPISTFLSNLQDSGFKDYKRDQKRYDIFSVQKICFIR